MKIKQFHEYSELDDPVVVQPTAFGGEQKLTHLYLAQLATERYKSKLRWNTDERGWHCFDNESGMWQRIGTEQIIALLIFWVTGWKKRLNRSLDPSLTLKRCIVLMAIGAKKMDLDLYQPQRVLIANLKSVDLESHFVML
jgi:hypothetical protein